VPSGVASNTSSWSSTGHPNPPFSVHGAGVWSGNHRLDEFLSGPLFGTSNSNGAGLGTSLFMGMEVAAPASEQTFPAAQGALPSFRPRTPPLNWGQAPGPPWRSTHSWDNPMHTVGRHSGPSSTITFPGRRSEILPVQLATSSVPLECRVMSTGHLPSTTTPHSVRPLIHSDPVLVARTFLFAVVDAFFSR